MYSVTDTYSHIMTIALLWIGIVARLGLKHGTKHCCGLQLTQHRLVGWAKHPCPRDFKARGELLVTQKTYVMAARAVSVYSFHPRAPVCHDCKPDTALAVMT